MCLPEVLVCALSQLVHLLLKGPTGPVNGEMDVLKQHPATVLVGVSEVVHGNGLLALAQGDSSVVTGVSCEAQLLTQAFHTGCHIHTRRQEDEDGCARRGVLQKNAGPGEHALLADKLTDLND